MLSAEPLEAAWCDDTERFMAVGLLSPTSHVKAWCYLARVSSARQLSEPSAVRAPGDRGRGDGDLQRLGSDCHRRLAPVGSPPTAVTPAVSTRPADDNTTYT